MATILLKFAGPLQSYGTSSHFETRHTDLYPSKSAVLGMVAACLGYRRQEKDKLQLLNTLDFAVRVDQVGKLLKDYHTAKKYKKNGDFERTYVTNRYYVEDAVFLAALSHEDSDFIARIAEALLNPYFQPFLGRRALPLTADFFQGVHEEKIITLLKKYPWQANQWYQKLHSNQVTIYFDAHLLNESPRMMRKDRPESFDQAGRRFNIRYEASLDVQLDSEYGEHDAFSALGGDEFVSI
ncbi:type I-E CRISPR-associated protein Cas5/CasD [Facklamia hominis]|uniref:type I-E CRISPR-associated protein Cas5/CasD n=1 Tax=Facklamia hominis TaxID=178214 RepID=UPI000C7BE42F|nr:type I-E CRISPR-associated protein Cas5/CasD [Facklamia hominis]PKY92820.1 type I-E CRISPR-associated protein Cas5/CasD [Facklamia hominis]